eukprot:TRINITY_DN764_c0_g1_i8.p1 TRINITY_DN764_c0_g1~~TRINITY_DN764_c0_g1_i8.p1  ORF type:complete len:238 (+),score=28.87 TRINITY_DN764_c0_g1_i8:392-1105(+)
MLFGLAMNLSKSHLICVPPLRIPLLVFLLPALPRILVSGSLPPVTELNLILEGFVESDRRRQLRVKEYNDPKVPLKIPGWQFTRVQDSITLSASNEFKVRLSGIIGKVMGLFVTVRSAPNTATGQNTFQSLADLDIKCSNESYLGNKMTHLSNKIEAAELFNNLYFVNKDVYFISFSSNPVGDFASGSSSGHQVFNGEELLVFTTPAGLSSGTFQIDVEAITACHFNVAKGVIEVRT